MVRVPEFFIQLLVSVGDSGFTEQFLQGILYVGFGVKDGLLFADIAHGQLDLHDGFTHQALLDLVHRGVAKVVVFTVPFST